MKRRLDPPWWELPPDEYARVKALTLDIQRACGDDPIALMAWVRLAKARDVLADPALAPYHDLARGVLDRIRELGSAMTAAGWKEVAHAMARLEAASCWIENLDEVDLRVVAEAALAVPGQASIVAREKRQPAWSARRDAFRRAISTAPDGPAKVWHCAVSQATGASVSAVAKWLERNRDAVEKA